MTGEGTCSQRGVFHRSSCSPRGDCLRLLAQLSWISPIAAKILWPPSCGKKFHRCAQRLVHVVALREWRNWPLLGRFRLPLFWREFFPPFGFKCCKNGCTDRKRSRENPVLFQKAPTVVEKAFPLKLNQHLAPPMLQFHEAAWIWSVCSRLFPPSSQLSRDLRWSSSPRKTLVWSSFKFFATKFHRCIAHAQGNLCPKFQGRRKRFRKIFSRCGVRPFSSVRPLGTWAYARARRGCRAKKGFMNKLAPFEFSCFCCFLFLSSFHSVVPSLLNLRILAPNKVARERKTSNLFFTIILQSFFFCLGTFSTIYPPRWQKYFLPMFHLGGGGGGGGCEEN